jgi:hypothetical protein
MENGILHCGVIMLHFYNISVRCNYTINNKDLKEVRLNVRSTCLYLEINLYMHLHQKKGWLFI